MVSSLKLSNGKWDEESLFILFDQATTKNIKNMFWAKRPLNDKLILVGSKSGSLIVRLAYSLEENEIGPEDAWWKHLWKSRSHRDQSFFLVKACKF